MLRTYLDTIRTKLPPSGQPFLHYFEADAYNIIDRLSDHDDASPEPGKVSEKEMASTYEWLFKKMIDCYTDDKWTLLCLYLLQLKCKELQPELIAKLTPPSVGNGA